VNGDNKPLNKEIVTVASYYLKVLLIVFPSMQRGGPFAFDSMFLMRPEKFILVVSKLSFLTHGIEIVAKQLTN
jgi:hypothetical protein